jgi:uncharacterized damage-inducible protein DinB
MHETDRAILDHFASTRADTIELVRRIPDELLARTPDGEERSLDAHFLHVAECTNWWMGEVMGDGKEWRLECERDRESIVAALDESRDRLLAFFEATDGESLGTPFEIEHGHGGTRETKAARVHVLDATDHEVHHRAKVMGLLRQMGFTDFPILSVT